MNLMEWEVGIPGKANVSVYSCCICDCGVLMVLESVAVAMGWRRLQASHDLPRRRVVICSTASVPHQLTRALHIRLSV